MESLISVCENIIISSDLPLIGVLEVYNNY